MALSPLKITTGEVMMCLALKSDAPVFIEPFTKSLTFPANHVMSMVASGWKRFWS
jgi:hypothetical protein